MANVQNYQALLFVAPFYASLVLLVALPPPWGVIALIFGFVLSFFFIAGTPTYATYHVRGFKQKWVQPICDEDAWSYSGRFQLWYKADPVSVWMEDAKEWFTTILCAKAYGHPKYNGGKKVLFLAYFLHGWYSVLETDEGLTDEDRYNIGQWEQLFPNHGGWVSYLSYLVNSPNSDWMDAEEVLPSREDMVMLGKLADREAESLEYQVVSNHVPIIKNNKEHALYRITKAQGSYKKKKEILRRRKMLAEAIAR